MPNERRVSQFNLVAFPRYSRIVKYEATSLSVVFGISDDEYETRVVEMYRELAIDDQVQSY